MKKNSLYSSKGVSFIELIVVIAIVAILAASATPFLSRFVLQIYFDTTMDKVVGSIRKAQEYAMDGKNNTTWGVCVSSGSIRLYAGSCASPTISDTFSVPSTVTVSGLSDITFNKRGEPSSTITVSVSTSLESGSVTVNSGRNGNQLSIMHYTFRIKEKGFGIIELIVAMAIFAIIAVTGAVVVIGSFSTNRLGNEETQANLYAQEGIEAARSISNQGWQTPFLATNCTSGCGVTNSGGSWAWSGTSSNTSGDYTRVITVSDVQRNGSGDIVASGGTNDPDTKKVLSTVTWTFSAGRSNTVELVTYLTNWTKLLPTPTPTASPSPTSTPSTCSEYAISQGYSSGTCRQNTTQCGNNGETHLSGGDSYCTGGPSADTCCVGPLATPTPTGSVIPTATPTLTPTPTSAVSTCAQYCVNNGFTTGTCRQNTTQCNNNGQSHQAGGDIFCTGGSSADTCCCN